MDKFPDYQGVRVYIIPYMGCLWSKARASIYGTIKHAQLKLSHSANCHTCKLISKDNVYHSHAKGMLVAIANNTAASPISDVYLLIDFADRKSRGCCGMCLKCGTQPTTHLIRQYHSQCGQWSNRCYCRLPPVETCLQLLSVTKPLQFADMCIITISCARL